MNFSEPLILLIPIFILATIITLIIKFYQGIWNIHISINKQNEILNEQNEILLKFLELEEEKRQCNS